MSGIWRHTRVYRMREDDDSAWSDEWACGTCKAQFFHLQDAHLTGKITLAEPQPTLRDQFAMAALKGYIGCDKSGTSFWSTGPQMVDSAKNAYEWAGAMMEARK